MGISDLQVYIQNFCNGACVTVDLLRIARNRKPLQSGRKLKLVLDAECCLDRLYGGYFSDWASGGQWNRMVQFLSILVQQMNMSGIELVVFFNGALELPRFAQWSEQQQNVKRNVNSVMRHLATKGTPPPKVWWVPPVCLRTALRMALRHLNVTVVCSMDDHRQEVIAYCRENNLHGLLVEDPEYVAFDPPRYFSAENLKLTYKGSLETKEYLLPRIAESLGLNPQNLPSLAALLGTQILPEHELLDFHRKCCPEHPTGKIPSEVLVRGIASFIAKIPNCTQADQVATSVFENDSVKASKLTAAIQYFLNGTNDGFLNYRTTRKGQKKAAESLKFASETVESERDSLAAYREATANSTPLAPQIVVQTAENTVNGVVNGLSALQLSSSSSSSTASPSHSNQNKTAGPLKIQSKAEDNEARMRGLVSVEVLRTACERHQKGLMSPLIYQILTQGEIKLNCVLEDDQSKEFPRCDLFYRPVRQMVYGILLNLHHKTYMQQEQEHPAPPDLYVNEWLADSNKPHKVKPEKLGWGVPTVQRLWFGSVHSSTIDDKRRRLRAFLSCMRSDTPLMLSPAHVPQPMLLFACVVRYMMCFPEHRILRRHELDALIAQAHSPELMNATYLQDLQLPRLNQRGVELASMVMSGVEAALLANDACGAPIPWLMCCPWLFFDGKLFQHKLLKAETCKNLVELCDHRFDEVLKVERMRQAILEGIEPNFARPPLCPGPAYPVPLLAASANPVLAAQSLRGHRGQRPVIARGGQLEIAGVVVGQWGPNYGTRGGNNRGVAPLGGGVLQQQQHHPMYRFNSNHSNANARSSRVNKPSQRNNAKQHNSRMSNKSKKPSLASTNTATNKKTKGANVPLTNGKNVLVCDYDKTAMLNIGKFEQQPSSSQQ